MVKKNITKEYKADSKEAEYNEVLMKRMADKEAGLNVSIPKAKAKPVEEVVAEEVLEEPKKKAE